MNDFSDPPDPYALDFEDLAAWYGSSSDHATIARPNQWKLLGVDVPESDHELILKLGGPTPPSPTLEGLFNRPNVAYTSGSSFEDVTSLMQMFNDAHLLKPLNLQTIELEDGSLLQYESDTIKIGLDLKWDFKPDPLKLNMLTRFGGFDVRTRSILTIDPTPAWQRALHNDGWFCETARGWARADGGLLTHSRVYSGRYVARLPTNRKRKRARCKARRRFLLDDQHRSTHATLGAFV